MAVCAVEVEPIAVDEEGESGETEDPFEGLGLWGSEVFEGAARMIRGNMVLVRSSVADWGEAVFISDLRDICRLRVLREGRFF